ncbi:MAG: aminoglycoside 6-adenylyltransferase [Clostridiaceae bacterium]|nr:aminoglycoside 6-adenylyltransferase [Clostridiaceae bacterium]
MAEDRKTPDNFHRGVRVLVDKDNVSSYIVPSGFKPVSALSVDERTFIRVIDMFFISVVYIAKQIIRGELWTAKTRENDMRLLLLQMLEWHAKALHGDDYDVWHGGRFIHEWIDQETFKELKNTFSQYDEADTLRGLLDSISLFRRIASETADRLGLKYPQDTDNHITDWITKNTESKLIKPVSL